MLRALSSPNLDIRRKTLDIALDLITSRNIDEVRGAGCQCMMTQHVVLIFNSTGGGCSYGLRW